MFVSAGSARTHGDITVGELALERCDVVPLDHASRLRKRRPAGPHWPPAKRPVTFERRERLVDRSVIAPVEDEDLRPPRELAREPDGETIRVGRRQRELPAREAEAASELLPDPEGVLARQHERDPSRCLLGHSPHGRRRRVTGHCGRVPEAEIDVLVTVDVTEARAARRPLRRRRSLPPSESSTASAHRRAASARPAGPGHAIWGDLGRSARARGQAGRRVPGARVSSESHWSRR